MFSWLFTSKEEKARLAKQKLSLDALAAGKLPLTASERIERELALGKKFESSDLTVNEHLFTRESGIEVIGQVLGSSFWSVRYRGTYQGRWNTTGEMTDLSKAHLDARAAAMKRMQMEAAMLGAAGVIGVKLKSNAHDWSSGLTEFTAMGTAVRIPGWQGEPFVSALSAQEFWQLYQAGYLPVGLAMGVCSYYMYTDGATQNLLYSWWGGNNRSNVEIPLYTQGLQVARELAMDRLSTDIAAHNADGSVGMDIEFEMEHIEYESGSRTYHDMIAHFLALGTTIVYRPELCKTRKAAPLMMIDLKAGRKGRHGPVPTKLDELGRGHTQPLPADQSAVISFANAPTVRD